MSSENQFKRPQTLQDLFNDDPFGLLSDVGEKKAKMCFSDKVTSSFEEVAAFIRLHHRLPQENSDNFDEEVLARKYMSMIITNPDGRDYCESLLPEELRTERVERIQRTTLTREAIIKKQVDDMQSRVFDSIEGVMEADPFGLLSDDSCNDLGEHEEWRDSAEYQARRNEVTEPKAQACKCVEFAKFKPYFDEVKRLLSAGHIKQVKVVGGDEINIEPGQFFVIDGVLSMIAEANLSDKTVTKGSSKVRYRVRQIFENGTEIMPFNTSVKASFYKSEPPCVRLVEADEIGHQFIQGTITDLDDLFNKLERKPDGYVYILGTLSMDPVIRRICDMGYLIKIGYTDRSVEERLIDAHKSPTYLCAPVEVLAKIECYNFDANALEFAMHTLLHDHRLNVQLRDGNGNFYRPEEWFTVSVDTAIELVNHIMAGDLDLYYIDKIQGKLKLKHK